MNTLNKNIILSCAPIGSKVKVIALECSGITRRRMMDLGIVPGTVIEVLRRSPLGDPTAYSIKEALIALREEEAKNIIVERVFSEHRKLNAE